MSLFIRHIHSPPLSLTFLFFLFPPNTLNFTTKKQFHRLFFRLMDCSFTFYACRGFGHSYNDDGLPRQIETSTDQGLKCSMIRRFLMCCMLSCPCFPDSSFQLLRFCLIPLTVAVLASNLFSPPATFLSFCSPARLHIQQEFACLHKKVWKSVDLQYDNILR
jgi:hypothetical protein